MSEFASVAYRRVARVAAGLTSACDESSHVWWQLATAILVVVYAIALFVVTRPASGYLTLWDGWLVNVVSTLPVVAVLLRVWHKTDRRFAWLAIAAGIALNSAGNLLYTYHDQNLVPIPNPAPSDLPYLLSHVMFVVGVVAISQRSFGRTHASVRLDGAVTGLTLGAVAGTLWFGPVLKISGRPLEVAVGMAYPLLDLVLLVLLAAGLAPQRYRPSWSTGLLMAGVLAFVVGDVVYLNQSAADTYSSGTPLELTWIVGVFLLGLAAWAREDRRSASRRHRVASSDGIAMVPVVSGFVSLGVLVASFEWHVPTLAACLAIAALGVVIVRMVLTLRELRQAATNYRDARTDDLTGLANRRAFQEAVESDLRSTSDDRHVGVLLVDLDGFKEINDSLGHHVGDELLRIVANRFESRIAARGSIARIGGDEFACTQIVGCEADLVRIAHELEDALAGPVALDGVTVRVGASIGASMSPEHGSTHEELLRCADVAMYEAKHEMSVVRFYRADRDPNSRELLALVDELRVAIETRTLTLYYQPTLALRSASVHGLEALVRWQHPTRGLMQPDSFIPLAERVGLIPQLTRAVLEQAIGEAARLDARGHPLHMSINVSRYDLVDEDLPQYIDMLLEQHDVPHDRITLEITESALSDDPDRAARCIHELRDRGLRVSIDDYGVGYSSMSQLLGLRIDELKIDKSFVLALETDRRAQAIIRSAVELGQALDLTVVAEGIESAETLRLVRRLGADIGQGYYICRPLTRDLLDDYLAEPAHHHGLLPEQAAPSLAATHSSP
jgi:diguanylate cyclase (GGDEF)-like protein